MVVFGLFGKQKFVKEKDILDELMGIDSIYIANSLDDTRKSSNHDLNSLEQELQDECKRKQCHSDDTYKMDVYKNLIITLQEQITSLTADVEFLRQDSLNKSNTINDLTSISNIILRKYNKDNNKAEFSNNTSNYNNNVSLYNQQVSYNDQVTPNNKGYGTDESEASSCDILNSSEMLDVIMSTPNVNETADVKQNVGNENINETKEEADEEEDENDDSNITQNQYKWEKFSNGFAGKQMNKMGFKGNGLGRREDGITEPIMAQGKQVFNQDLENMMQCNKQIYILSDSMLNQIDDKRLSKKCDVKVKCHGGCTIKCIYKHLPEIAISKPNYIIVHVSTNDSTTKTSDEILREINKLVDDINKILPNCEVIVSTPIGRLDNSTANTIIHNLNTKLKRSKHRLLDNSNIKPPHIGRKGLHLNEHGTKKMAMNIISLIKRL